MPRPSGGAAPKPPNESQLLSRLRAGELAFPPLTLRWEEPRAMGIDGILWMSWQKKARVHLDRLGEQSFGPIALAWLQALPSSGGTPPIKAPRPSKSEVRVAATGTSDHAVPAAFPSP